MNTRKKRMLRPVALFLLLNMMMEILFPAMAMALTSGPAQPEFSSFEPIQSSNMVDEFTGDFTYNLPVLEVPGPHGSAYAMSLAYHSQSSPESEASWVGYGWSLNAGSINRNVVGYPDDFDGQEVKIHNKMPTNWTATVGAGVEFEGWSIDSPSLDGSISYNNYRGFTSSLGLGAQVGKGLVSLGYSVTNGDHSFSLQLNPAAYYFNKAGDSRAEAHQKMGNMSTTKEGMGLLNKATRQLKNGFKAKKIMGSYYPIVRNGVSAVQGLSHFHEYVGGSAHYSVGYMGTFTPFQIGATLNVLGSFSYQKNKEMQNLNAYGFLYSALAETDDANAAMDFHMEKETPYEKRNVFLGVPFHNADQFMVSGQGVGGGFRFFQQQNGVFIPNRTNSETAINTIGLEIEAGVDNGAGADAAKVAAKILGKGKLGFQSLISKGWHVPEDHKFSNPLDAVERQEVIAKFSNDMGGSWLPNSELSNYAANEKVLIDQYFKNLEKPEQAGIDLFGDFDVRELDLKLGRPKTEKVTRNTMLGEKVGRSSFIHYRTNQEINNSLNGEDSKYNIYTLRADINEAVDRTKAEIAQGLGEIAVVNESGATYNYGLPVYNKNNVSLQLGLGDEATFEDGYMAYKLQAPDRNKIAIGEEKKSAYANTFLLTDIYSPDYIDRTLDGPTQDDFGGYTRFNYEKVHDDFVWRMPYNGFLYQRKSLSDANDDVGFYSQGEKEIHYLKSIETKTHVAFFVTSDREDGKSASSNFQANGQSAIPDMSSRKSVKKLDRIELYAVNDLPASYFTNGILISPVKNVPENVTPLKTIHFDYFSPEEALSQGVSNNAQGQGKLSLKRIWFTYQGSSSLMSPYHFTYHYPATQGVTYPTGYAAIGEEYSHLVPYTNADGKQEDPQNPDYNPRAIDAWGNYQAEGDQRYKKMKNWVNQAPDQVPGQPFDPAAYHLKTVKLPTGGEIHVQYEQDDYAYVQNEPAHVMMSLKSAGSDDKTFVLNAADIQNLSALDKGRLADMIRNRYVDQGHKIYFKFLYRLLGNANPQIEDCNAEYISGYVDVARVETIAGDIVLTLGKDNDDESYLPRKVCKDFYSSQRKGKVDEAGNCSPQDQGAFSISENDFNNEGWVDKGIGAIMKIKQLDPFNAIPYCKEINPSLSYFRVPTPTHKLGGGTRVKRLLMFDQGYANTEGVLYGNEYRYEFFDRRTNTWRSSGVATNEPGTIREENILTDFISRKRFQVFGLQDGAIPEFIKDTYNLYNKVIGGDNKNQTEGPIGESALPGPSVGYSRVTVSNIHKGKTSPGFSVKEFHTALDHPLKVEMSEMDRKRIFAPMPIDKLKIGLYLDLLFVTQGFSIITNNMHGQPKMEASYSGTYLDASPGARAKSLTGASAKVNYQYYDFGKKETVPVLDRLNGRIIQSLPGTEVEVVQANKSVLDNYFNGHIEADLSFGPPFFIQVSGFPYLTGRFMQYHTHATTKMINYPAIVKKISSEQDGIVHHTEHLAFDKYSGKPMATRSYDEYDGVYMTQNTPASWEYKNMKPMADNAGMIVNISSDNITDREGSTLWVNLANLGEKRCEVLESFTEGDVVVLKGGDEHAAYSVAKVDLFNERLLLWPTQEGHVKPPNPTSLQVVRSGNSNQLNAKVGAITFHSSIEEDFAEAVTINTDDQYAEQVGTNTFPQALEAELHGISEAQMEGSFTIVGNFIGFDLSGFASCLPACVVDPANVTLKEVVYEFQKTEDEIQLMMVSIQLLCPDSTIETVDSCN